VAGGHGPWWLQISVDKDVDVDVNIEMDPELPKETNYQS